jgi:hypothetical protein
MPDPSHTHDQEFSSPPLPVNKVPPAELRRLVQALQQFFYRDDEVPGGWDADRDVNGGDLVEWLGGEFDRLGLSPPTGPKLLGLLEITVPREVSAKGLVALVARVDAAATVMSYDSARVLQFRITPAQYMRLSLEEPPLPFSILKVCYTQPHKLRPERPL